MASRGKPAVLERSETAREGIFCPACGSGRWQLTKTPHGWPRCRCSACGKTWPGRPEWKGEPGAGCTPPETVATIRRALTGGIRGDKLLAQVAGCSAWVAGKYRRRWLAEVAAGHAAHSGRENGAARTT